MLVVGFCAGSIVAHRLTYELLTSFNGQLRGVQMPLLQCVLLQPVNSDSPTEISSLLSLLLSRCVTSVNPHVRQAACVWLLAVVIKCSRFSEVQSSIMSIQDAFIALLSETDGKRSTHLCYSRHRPVFYNAVSTT